MSDVTHNTQESYNQTEDTEDLFKRHCCLLKIWWNRFGLHENQQVRFATWRLALTRHRVVTCWSSSTTKQPDRVEKVLGITLACPMVLTSESVAKRLASIIHPEIIIIRQAASVIYWLHARCVIHVWFFMRWLLYGYFFIFWYKYCLKKVFYIQFYHNKCFVSPQFLYWCSCYWLELIS
jgi:hypothetical protein